jgi:hypothetical protein
MSKKMSETGQRSQKAQGPITGLKEAKNFLQGPYTRRTKELLKLNRNPSQYYLPERTPFQIGINLQSHL